MAILKWHCVTKPGDGKVTESREKWRKIIKEENSAPSYKEWTVEEDAVLTKLKATPIWIKELQSVA